MYIYSFLLYKRSSAHSSIVTVGFGKRETGKMSNGKNEENRKSKPHRYTNIPGNSHDGRRAKAAQPFLQGEIRREDNFARMSDYILKTSKSYNPLRLIKKSIFTHEHTIIIRNNSRKQIKTFKKKTLTRDESST